MNAETATTALEDRELRNLASTTGADPDVINRIMSAAAEAGIAYLLPPLRATGHYPEWGAFALPGSGKSAHLLVEGEETALCGVQLPYGANFDLPRGTPLCIGCAFHGKRMTDKSFNAVRLGRSIRATSMRAATPESPTGGSAIAIPVRVKAATPTPVSNDIVENDSAASAPPAPEPTVAVALPAKAPSVRTSPPPSVAPPKPAPVNDAPSLFDLAS